MMLCLRCGTQRSTASSYCLARRGMEQDVGREDSVVRRPKCVSLAVGRLPPEPGEGLEVERVGDSLADVWMLGRQEG